MTDVGRLSEAIMRKWHSADGTAIGQGGQAVVHLITDSTGNKFAKKTLAPKKPKEAYARFKREIEAIRKLDHPNIIKVVDSSDDPNDPYYVMEYIDGAISLREAMTTGQNPYRNNALKSVEFFIQIAEVVKACETVKIVHRDFSPCNVLLTPDGRIKVIDFGVCQMEGSETLTLTDESVGTHNYMAPECESGSDAEIDCRADLYSAGKLLWSAITNQKAFARESPVFNTKSMCALFETDLDAWYLHQIFEGTVRHKAEDRFPDAEEAIRVAENVVVAIRQKGAPPEWIDEYSCPSCYIGVLEGFQGSHMVFGNPPPEGIDGVRCTECGICFAIDFKLLRTRMNDRKKLL
jgi:serine/threonine protein kinase